jgi:hypothetical protein
LSTARDVNVQVLPTVERRARFAIDVAKAWHRFGKPDKCVQALQAAARFAPEEVYERVSVKTFVAGLLDGRGATPAGLSTLAARCGLR